MDFERFRELTEAYGADERRWPAEERAAMRSLLEHNEAARQLRLAARDLDLLLDSYQPPMEDLSARILARLPRRSPLEGLLDWLFPGGLGSLLRPAAAAAMPLCIGVGLGIALPADTTAASAGWEEQERALITAEVNWYD